MSYRLDRNRNEGGMTIFTRDDIPSKLLTKHVFQMILKVRLLSWILQKWLIFETYPPPSEIDSSYFNNLDNALDLYSHYDNFSWRF